MVGIGKIMKQAQKMQQEVARIQEELARREITSSSGGGALKIRMTCDKKMQGIEIEEDLLSAENRDMLEDMLVAGMNQAMDEVDRISSEEMGKVTQGMGVPGMF